MFRPVAGSPPKPYFLFVGTLEPRKNVGMLIEAWRALRRESDADLMLVGRRREDFPPLPAEPGLLVLGETPEEALPGLYSSALAVIYPSQYEGFGLPVLEAMQSGAPVIVSRDPALTEVSGGAAVQVSTAPELYAAMREVLRNPEFRAAQSAKSLARAKQFSWPDTALRTHEVYEEAVARFAS
jgi:glycosyltransferase involved in cell wall biosynthesis